MNFREIPIFISNLRYLAKIETNVNAYHSAIFDTAADVIEQLFNMSVSLTNNVVNHDESSEEFK